MKPVGVVTYAIKQFFPKLNKTKIKKPQTQQNKNKETPNSTKQK